jgi:hypothetical protein
MSAIVSLAIRLALRASPHRLVRSLLASAAVFTALCCALGSSLTFWLGPVIAKLMGGAGAVDGWMLTAPLVVMLLTATGASYIPGRRAARVDPAVNLRAD